MKKELNIFHWDDENTEGSHSCELGTIGDYGEVDLSDERAKWLLGYIKDALDEGSHISFSIPEN